MNWLFLHRGIADGRNSLQKKTWNIASKSSNFITVECLFTVLPGKTELQCGPNVFIDGETSEAPKSTKSPMA